MVLVHVRAKGEWFWGIDTGQGEVLQVEEAGLWERVMGGGAPRETGVSVGAGEVEAWEVPARPTKVVCVGLNYKRHAEEQGKPLPQEPLIFMKPVSALLGSGGQVELPEQSQLVHHEAELAVVMGRRTRKVSKEEALERVFGYTCANDVTARDIQQREGRYTRAKGFDTFCPLGPGIRVARGFEVQGCEVVGRVNGQERQRGRVDDMIFGVGEVIAFVSQVMTLEAGDVILTGTPSGVGVMEAGDRVEVEVGGIGVLWHGVK